MNILKMDLRIDRSFFFPRRESSISRTCMRIAGLAEIELYGGVKNGDNESAENKN